MEITAAIVGLQMLNCPCQVTIHSDSQYLVDTITKGWAQRWRQNGWRRDGKHKALNHDLWETLLDLCARHEVAFVWVRGHAGNPENERCDQLSVQAAQGTDLPADEFYEEAQARSQSEPSLFD
jgi:ribonuclease HI